MLTKITLEVAHSKNVLVHLRPSSKLWARILQHFQMYRCTFLLLCLPKALHYHLTVYKHVCLVGNASISANRRICGFTHIQACCVCKGLISDCQIEMEKQTDWSADRKRKSLRGWWVETYITMNSKPAPLVELWFVFFFLIFFLRIVEFLRVVVRLFAKKSGFLTESFDFNFPRARTHCVSLHNQVLMYSS